MLPNSDDLFSKIASSTCDLMVVKLWTIVKLTDLHMAYCEINLLNCIVPICVCVCVEAKYMTLSLSMQHKMASVRDVLNINSIFFLFIQNANFKNKQKN